ncbi:MAG: bifunctional phosphoribosyl-AMP cyclohydrolase/phosphoribosyl-ATP diphosphatase HisIE [Methanomassiliicoccales archaeon]|jgi:phosphoribosyl-ATP pyrophosphohydrolase/phosphoribosyl-AMP cyclohydrolase|nr:bifunctional phosphoribosyl-AMP cyclohydrolase/phosphoribosyl-ATP diphosphatase HisIE [Methanomassiliicoccales archaeon]MDD1756212.1 bifunctional phosphoribosyl-AMP cyclohydrolase/phosphoribosyl-ATP diphosphatase HisIE [Methanomassiliicoccales archaeon]
MTELKFDEKGLIPVIVQDALTSEVLMMAYANREAYDKMMETKRTHFYSRSRQRLWMKGETSGHVQDIVSMQADCDGDCLLVRVNQTGVACHLERPSCFEELLMGDLKGTSAILPELVRVIHDRKVNPKEGSYTSSLFANEDKMLKKIVEEAAEIALASKSSDKKMQAWEVADLIYHLLVVLEGEDISLEQVYRQLSERRK